MRLYRLRRHPVGAWLLTFLLAALAYGLVARAQDSAASAVRRWGRVVPVVVVRRPVAAGAVVGQADVAVVSAPARLVPSGSAVVESVAEAVGRTALVDLVPGELLLRARLAPDGLTGVAALVPPGMRAIAIPLGGSGSGSDSSASGALRLSVGDAVDVLATFPNDPASGPPTITVASSALVVEVRADAVTLAVAPSAASRIAYALARASVTLTLSPPGSAPVPTSPSTAEGQLGGGR
jgi:Flp pilus assembly protein CpaB